MNLLPNLNLADGTKIWYDIQGEGHFLVLNHGYGSSHKNFKNIIPFLKADFRCLTWDYRGHGDSDKKIGDTYEETEKIYSISQYVEDCHELLTKLDFINNRKRKKIFMFGISLGGMVSQTYAIKYQNTLKALGLGATAPYFNHPVSNIQISGPIPLSKQGIKLTAELGFTKKFLKKYPEFSNKKIDKKFYIYEDKLIIMPENFFGSFNTEKDLQKLSIPTIIVHGVDDEIMNIKWARRFQELIPNSKFIVYPKVTHNITKEIPELLAENINSFFLKTT